MKSYIENELKQKKIAKNITKPGADPGI